MTAASSSTSPDFATVGSGYAAYSGGGRGRLRHDITARRVLAEIGERPARVLDVGCGDGEMVLRLAAAGHHVSGVEKSPGMLEAAAKRVAAVPEIAERVTLSEGDIYTLPFDDAAFDAVVCHGVVMYLPDSVAPIAHLARLVADGGILSVLTKNRLAVGVREALSGDYASARAQIESGQAASVGNLGITTRGDIPDHLDDLARANGLAPCRGRACGSSTTTAPTGRPPRTNTRRRSRPSGSPPAAARTGSWAAWCTPWPAARPPHDQRGHPASDHRPPRPVP